MCQKSQEVSKNITEGVKLKVNGKIDYKREDQITALSTSGETDKVEGESWRKIN